MIFKKKEKGSIDTNKPIHALTELDNFCGLNYQTHDTSTLYLINIYIGKAIIFGKGG